MGVCSRHEADRPTEVGKVLIGDRPASMGQKVTPGQKVVYNERITRVDKSRKSRPVFLAVNKPRDIIYVATDKNRAENIVDFLGYSEWIYPVRRLDKNSEGLLLMTSQGDPVNKIMRSGNAHEEGYTVTTDEPVTEHFLEQMVEGIRLPELDQATGPCKAKKVERNTFPIILTQGLDRQIRRMREVYGYQVGRLVRVRIMNIRLGNLRIGVYRQITREEYEGLIGFLKGSPSLFPKERKDR